MKMENRNGLRMVMKIMMENILGKLKMGNQMEMEQLVDLMDLYMLVNG